MTTGRGAAPGHHLSGVPKEARPHQGRPAGLVTRAIAAVVDALAVLAMLAGALLLVNAAALAIRPLSFEPVLVPLPVTLLAGFVVSIAYLTTAWATTGRTVGAAVMGVRVVDAGGRARLHPGRALLRAAACTVFPIGLAWTAVSADRRSLHDQLTGSAVTYHWLPPV